MSPYVDPAQLLCHCIPSEADSGMHISHITFHFAVRKSCSHAVTETCWHFLYFAWLKHSGMMALCKVAFLGMLTSPAGRTWESLPIQPLAHPYVPEATGCRIWRGSPVSGFKKTYMGVAKGWKTPRIGSKMSVMLLLFGGSTTEMKPSSKGTTICWNCTWMKPAETLINIDKHWTWSNVIKPLETSETSETFQIWNMDTTWHQFQLRPMSPDSRTQEDFCHLSDSRSTMSLQSSTYSGHASKTKVKSVKSVKSVLKYLKSKRQRNRYSANSTQS